MLPHEITHLLAAFDSCAQRYGFASGCATEERAAAAEADYRVARERLEAAIVAHLAGAGTRGVTLPAE